MAALLIGLSIMAIMMTVVMPVWKQQVRREKEEELVFRGKQYVHAIGLYQKKVANTFPPNIDLLVEQRFLRKKFKDPITNDDFVPIPVGGAIPGQAAPAAGQRGPTGSTGSTGPGSTGGPGATGPTTGGTQAGGRGGGPPASSVTSPGQSAGGIMGVTSKSKEQSIRLYNGRGHYNEWAFLYVQAQQAPGAGAGGTVNPGQRGQPGQQPPAGVNPGGAGRGPNGPGGPGGRGPFGGQNGPGGRGAGPGGTSPFGGGGVTPIQPPTRGRL